MHVLYGTLTCPNICLTILKLYKKGIKIYFPGLGYTEILRRVNLDTLNVRRDSICQKYFDKIKVDAHILNYPLPDKRHTEKMRTRTTTNVFRNSFILGGGGGGGYNCQ